jgi:hypothetical protein
MVIDSRKPEYSHKHVSHCQFIQHEFHVYSRVTDRNRLTAISMPSDRHLVRKITNVHNISVKVCLSCPTLGVFRDYLVFGADLRLQMKTLSSPELPNCNCVPLVTDRHHVTPPFGPSTPTQQTGRPKNRTGCNTVCCPQPDVRKPRRVISLKCVHLAKADHFMMCPSYK